MATMARHPRVDAGVDVDAVLRGFGALEPVDVAFAASVPGNGTFVLDRFHGTRTDALAGAAVPIRDGLGGKCIDFARPVKVADYGVARGITHPLDPQVAREGLRAIFAVPIVVQGTVRTVVYGAARQPVRFGDRLVGQAADIVRRMVRDPAPPRPASPPGRGELHAELRAIAAQESDPTLRARIDALVQRLAEPAAPAEPLPVALSPRELDVLAAVAVGCGNAEVSRRLHLTEQTVKSYLKSAMYKLDSHSRGEAVHKARLVGLLA
jgi:DNA-binding CsgD family transcriptional regulator